MLPPVRYDSIPCIGGMDEVTPTLSLKPGFLRSCRNFEVSQTGGYSRIAGHERYDGRAEPHNASYYLIQFAAFVNTPSIGQTVAATSGGGGVIFYVGSNFIVITKKAGAFADGDAITVGAVTIGTQIARTIVPNSKTAAQYLNMAADVYRADIQPVPGSGPVRGVELFGDVLYAFRDNAGGTAVDLYKSTAAGWVQVPFFNEVSFTAGGASAPADGATLTQGGVTATIKRVVAQSGSWASNTAAGRFIVTNPAGGNFAAGAATIGAVNVTLSGAQTAITLAVGGKFEFCRADFYGQAGLRLYGCDGVNRAFEFDGTTLVPITTGASPDTPKHIVKHRDYLFLAIGSLIRHPGPGTPYRWTATDGAGEIAVGDTVTAFLAQPGSQTSGALAVFARSTPFVLYGTGASTWNLVTLNTGGGAIDYSAQNMAQSYVLDDRGVISLQASQNYGNFDQSSLTNRIKNYIASKRTLVANSMVSREKSQYRIFFSDGYGLYVTVVNGEVLGCMPVHFPVAVYSACSGEFSSGGEALFVGAATGGYVYRMDVGTSFDGDAITAYLKFNWVAANSPRMLKRYRRASIEMQGTSYAEISVGYSLAYASAEEMQPVGDTTYELGFGQSEWDAFVWDQFYWDSRSIWPAEIELQGTGENVQFVVRSSSDYLQPFSVNSLIYHYTPRRGLR